VGCAAAPPPQADGTGQAAQARELPAVNAAIAQTGSVREVLEYTGTTRPVREISLRSQVEGRLLSLNVDVGDPVSKGQVLARLDDNLLVAALNQSRAELATQESEVARARAQVSNARTQIEQARLALKQAQNDAERSQTLATQGALSAQQAELTETAERTAEQTLRSTQQQVRTEQQALAAAEGRVDAQRAVVAQARERLSQAVLASPINGSVLGRTTETGNLVRPGDALLSLGDFSRVKVNVQVSELDLSRVRVRQPVQVKLDAFANERFSGTVTRLSPAADPTTRLIPVEVTVANPGGRISSGLLARVAFSGDQPKRVLVPPSALPEGELTVFVIVTNEQRNRVEARPVEVGERANGQVEILSGLKAGERFVARSSRPLKDGEAVRLSFLSESQPRRPQ
ncbi:MAG: efflux RND transporter periplasmic adaptor subunit, partial [Gemmatimonadaceae bacterium]|nr:efflux RND transporter periplasmic adaptor subunit [Gloeobacterales cyanobacterium ES-bin-141]